MQLRLPTSFTCSTNANGTAWECLNRTIVIGGITQTTCATTTFTDPGGASNYPNNNSSGTTICPVTPGDKVSVTFNSFDIRATFGTCLDQLQIYQGNLPIISNQIGVFCTGTFPPTTITSNTADGSYIYFLSDVYGLLLVVASTVRGNLGVLSVWLRDMHSLTAGVHIFAMPLLLKLIMVLRVQLRYMTLYLT
ncbi:MAG: hypothetical protein IPQ04_10530 [Saprospiraceae bacterium]|nr:hypothetical protein [Saprospiraceae bacterium]